MASGFRVNRPETLWAALQRLGPPFGYAANPWAEIFAAILAALVAVSLLHVSAVQAAYHPAPDKEHAALGNAVEPRIAAFALTLSPEPQWQAINDATSGLAIELDWKWREAPGSALHEQEVTATSDWSFSRLYDCGKASCGSDVRAIISGGLLEAAVDINSEADLIDQMPRREAARIGAMIAGVPFIATDSLKVISRAGTYGYRLKVARAQSDDSKIVIMVDCLYTGRRFLILTAVTAAAEEENAEEALEDIVQGLTISAMGTRQTGQR